MRKPNPESLLAAMRWGASLMAAMRWAHATEADRQQSRENGKLGGRPRSDKPRCPCGKYTLHTAGLSRHKC